MRTKNPIHFALFMTLAVLLSGCGKADPKLAAENADLKARLQKLEQQLQASKSQMASPASPTASAPDLTGQLAEAQKKAEAAESDASTLRSQVEAQNAKIDSLARDLAAAQQARDKAEKALQLYRDKAASAIKQFQALNSSLGDKKATPDVYHQNYLATQAAVTKLTDALPESKVRREILGVLASFTHVNDAWETAARQMQDRTRKAQADYDKFVDFGGLGPNDSVVKMGKAKILAPAEQENAATLSGRDQQMASLEKNLDSGIKNLQALVNGQKA